MAERDIPDSWSPKRATEPDSLTRLSQTQKFDVSGGAGVPTAGSNSKSVKRRGENISDKTSALNQPQETLEPKKISRKLPRWTKSWILWTGLLAIVPGSIGLISVALLLKLPEAPNCPAIFWPLASASVRLNCAQLAASKHTVNDLLEAIALVKELPQSHPLHTQVNHFLEQWSQEILQLADQSFQAGNLNEALAIAHKIPSDVVAAKLVQDKIVFWQSTWSKAEGIYQKAQVETSQQHWHDAFMISAKLLSVDNKYWQNTKYEELTAKITKAKEDGDKLAKAESLADGGNVDSILKAINLAESIGKDSYVYQKAQQMIPTLGRKMLDLAQARLDRKDADGAISIAQEIPASTGLEPETQDFITLTDAQRNAWVGSVAGLQTAISQAQQIDSTRPVYAKAQQLIARWQLEIEDVAHLEKAQSLASTGTINDLAAAVNEAQLVPPSNPRGHEARKQIGQWVGQIETIQDQPYLDRAEELALSGDTTSLQAAITEASQIKRGRFLYHKAQQRIGKWAGDIQGIQDRPILNQAEDQATTGDLSTAINTAKQIQSGRSLSGEAQKDISNWQEEIDAKQNWKNAREVAVQGTPDALARAIRLAKRVPENNVLRNDANPAIDQWSMQLLDIARSQGQSDISKALVTAQLIPRGTAAYTLAQEQIKSWQQFLNPPQPVQTPEFQPSINNKGQ